MREEEIVGLPPCVLAEEQRAAYFRDGYVVLERFLDDDRLGALRGAMDDLARRADDPAACPPDFEFEEVDGKRRLRQVLCAADHHAAVWDHACDERLTGAIADLVGPDVMFRESNVAFKRPGGRGFPWHQDFVFVPATNRAVVMTIAYLDDVTTELGPTRVVPGSHRGPILDHYDAEGRWLGVVGDHELGRIDEARAVEIAAPAGSVLVTNAALVHGALANRGSRARPVVIAGYQAADAVPLFEIPYRSRYRWQVVRGASAARVHLEDDRWRMPPDWSGHDGVRIDNLYQRQD